MSISSLLTTPWAIEPQALQMIETVAARHYQGERADLTQIEAQLGRPLANSQAGYTLHGDVAVLRGSEEGGGAEDDGSEKTLHGSLG